METYLKEEKIKSKHEIKQGIESFFESFNPIFSSSNFGKVIVQVAPWSKNAIYAPFFSIIHIERLI